MTQSPNDPTVVWRDWKTDFLTLERTIEAFQQKNLPYAQGVSQGNVEQLLSYHLDWCRDLLLAEVNGGLEDTYQHEVDKLSADKASDAEQAMTHPLKET